MEQRVLGVMTRPEGYTQEEYFSCPLPHDNDHLLSNLYSPKNFFQGTGNVVQITRTENKACIQNISHPLPIAFFGIRGQAKLETGYSSRGLSEEVARKYFDKYLAVLDDASNVLT